MARKPEVVIEETDPEPKPKPAKKGEETPPATKSEGTDWKKVLIVAAFAVGGLFLIFRRKDAQKTASPPGKETGTDPGAPAGGRFAALRKL